MSLCSACGLQLSGESTLCHHHHGAPESSWAAGNRVLCDLIHRGIVPERLSFRERDEDFWVSVGPRDPQTAEEAAAWM